MALRPHADAAGNDLAGVSTLHENLGEFSVSISHSVVKGTAPRDFHLNFSSGNTSA
jgi:hypothetical protein